MTIDHVSIGQKLIRLKEVVEHLEEIKQTPRRDFVLDAVLQAATERFFILAIEIITDIGNHLLVDKIGKSGTSYENIIEQLGVHKLIPPIVAKRNVGMAGFRNKLIHAYDEVEPELVYRYLENGPDEFRAFAKAFAKFL